MARYESGTHACLEVMVNSRKMTLQAMGGKLGVSRQRVLQMIKKNRMYDVWVQGANERKESRRIESANQKAEISQKKELVSKICGILIQARDQKISEEPWPSRKAFEYLYSRKLQRKGTRVNYGNMKKLLEKYQEGNASLTQLAEHSGIREPVISCLLKKMELPTLVIKYRKGRRRFSHSELEFIGRCSNTIMYSTDISYFIGCGGYIIRRHSDKNGGSSLTTLFNSELNYYRAFEIYEAKKLRFKDEDICKLLDMGEKAVEYAFENQKRIENVIRHDLKVIYREKMPERYKFLF